MPKDWTEITDDELLNFDGSQTSIIERYGRIMQKRTIDALMDVRGGLHDVKNATHSLAAKLEERLAAAERAQREAAASQSKLQVVALALTVVIALSTIAYTWITWQAVQAQREANQIQRDAQATKK